MKKQIITVDFDDTLHTKAFPSIAEKRLKFFKAMTEAGNFQVIIVTARKENINEIVDFCKEYEIAIDGIIHNAGNKLEVLKKLGTIAHFEDSESITPLLAENGINTFFMGEYTSRKCKEEWKEKLKVQGVWHYYVKDGNTKGLEE